ncbi:hypothetical protein [Tessaracoccus palaemonis]|uniref:Uncharacterized protein n=1 Tax=Tessaracoccus palaemonis TaxID=2829499 RepID=A0ABX8SJ83_9ACTN|nr:hypothetical protein [Tessaracoccus palaemonis]QXT63441.1 hypothetical protein KDB89_02880 [Tessaracoccus palaemonis]
MATVTLTVCDDCVDEKRPSPSTEVDQYVVSTGSVRAVMMLCVEHAQPLLHYLARQGTSTQKRDTMIDYARIDAMHATMEQVEALRDEWLKTHEPV